MKVGLHEDPTNRTKIAELMRYQTSKSGDEQISPKEYAVRMKEGQNDIYYTAGENIAAVSYLMFINQSGLLRFETLLCSESCC